MAKRVWIETFVFRAKEIILQILFIIKSFFHGRDLELVLDNTKSITSDNILLFCTLRNEVPRIPYFLEYYRNIGVRHFIFVDNGSTDGFFDIVKNEKDISVWHTSASYKKAAFGMHWLNFLMRKYGNDKWCVVCDPDEFLVFPYCDNRNLYELAEFLESEKKRTFFSLIIDMYSKDSIVETQCLVGQNPLEVAHYFDKNGYVQTAMPTKEIWIQGGVRRREFFSDYPERSPALNKISFLKQRWSYSYLSSMHSIVPFFLNQPHCENHLAPTGCILHFKFLSYFKEKVIEEIQRKEHFDGSYEYMKYKKEIERQAKIYRSDCSVRFHSWQQLVDMGLMNTGQWF